MEGSYSRRGVCLGRGEGQRFTKGAGRMAKGWNSERKRKAGSVREEIQSAPEWLR